MHLLFIIVLNATHQAHPHVRRYDSTSRPHDMNDLACMVLCLGRVASQATMRNRHHAVRAVWQFSCWTPVAWDFASASQPLPETSLSTKGWSYRRISMANPSFFSCSLGCQWLFYYVLKGKGQSASQPTSQPARPAGSRNKKEACAEQKWVQSGGGAVAKGVKKECFRTEFFFKNIVIYI